MKRVTVIAALMITASLACGQKPSTLPPLIIIGTSVYQDTNAIPQVDVKTRADGSLIITGPEPVPVHPAQSKPAHKLVEPTVTPCYDT